MFICFLIHSFKSFKCLLVTGLFPDSSFAYVRHHSNQDLAPTLICILMINEFIGYNS